VRKLGFAALGAVILQGLLGGITVLLFLPPAVSIGHAGLAQIFFCLTITLAVVTSPAWKNAVQPVEDPMLRRAAAVTTALIYAQVIIGATMRHNDAGLAIPDFPTAFGHVIPPVWNAKVAIHFAHRVGAMIVALAILATSGHVLFHHLQRRDLVRPALLMLALVSMQVTLGAFVIWSGKNPLINTAHVVNGAALLATSLALTLRSFRAGFERTVQPVRTPVQDRGAGAREGGAEDRGMGLSGVRS
jgi:cytochrome c oxidase assembly protein subunit 15